MGSKKRIVNLLQQWCLRKKDCGTSFLFNEFANQIHLCTEFANFKFSSKFCFIYYFERLSGAFEHRWKTLTAAYKKLNSDADT
jgi:hypothetical protein